MPSRKPGQARNRLEPWQVLQSREIFSVPPWITVNVEQVRLPDGKIIDDYHQINLTDFSLIYAETADEKVIVERQYKHGIGRVSLTLPAGSIEEDEEPVTAAQRELFEETGYASDLWQSMGTFKVHGNYGCCNGHLFRASGARKVSEPDSNDLEEMEILTLTRKEIMDALMNGEIGSMGTAALIAMSTNPLLNHGNDLQRLGSQSA